MIYKLSILNFIVEKEKQGIRLDNYISVIFPEKSFKQRQQLCNSGLILVNGQRKAKGYILRQGDLIEIFEEKVESTDYPKIEFEVLYNSDEFIAFYKPSFVHTTKGNSANSLENWLENSEFKDVRLLNRLDFETSGLVLGAHNLEAFIEYKKKQSAGQMRKYYIALVEGNMEIPLLISQKIDMNNCSKVKILPEISNNICDYTCVLPIKKMEEKTLVLARIVKGKRHQIRAHLAFSGYPLVGDGVYNANCQNERNNFYLHHIAFVMNQHTIFSKLNKY